MEIGREKQERGRAVKKEMESDLNFIFINVNGININFLEGKM